MMEVSLKQMREWIEKENVSGSTLAEYVDSPTEKDLGIREEFYDDNKVMISALVVLTIAIGLVARFAYELSGDRKMPTPIWETNEKSLDDLIDFASKTNLYNQEKVNRIIDFLISNHDTINQQKIDKNAILSFVTKN